MEEDQAAGRDPLQHLGNNGQRRAGRDWMQEVGCAACERALHAPGLREVRPVPRPRVHQHGEVEMEQQQAQAQGQAQTQAQAQSQQEELAPKQLGYLS